MLTFFAATMKPKIVLKRIFHRNEWRYAIIFPYEKKLTGIVKSVEGIRWSQTNECWCTPESEKTLKQILTLFREYADIDISAIVSGGKEKIPEKNVLVPVEMEEKPVSPPVIIQNKIPAEKQVTHYPHTIKRTRYGPVLFTICETDERLVIKFTGSYDKEWIEELKRFGRPYYDSFRNEWLIIWSQLNVDSLSDYFSSRGVEVIVKKQEVPAVVKEIRFEQGGEVRDRSIGATAMDGIEQVRQHLEEKRYSKRTIQSYITHLGLFFKYFNDREPHEIRESDISGFMENHIIRLGYSPSYQNLIISAIKMFYTISGLRRPGLDSFERPRRRKSLPKVFSKEEIKRILDAPRNSKHKLILWIIYSCGLRRSEVINIRLTDLDRERNLVNIREGKGKVDRIVPVPAKVWAKIDEYTGSYNPVTYLFEGQAGEKYSVESVYHVFKQALKLRVLIKKSEFIV